MSQNQGSQNVPSEGTSLGNHTSYLSLSLWRQQLRNACQEPHRTDSNMVPQEGTQSGGNMEIVANTVTGNNVVKSSRHKTGKNRNATSYPLVPCQNPCFFPFPPPQGMQLPMAPPSYARSIPIWPCPRPQQTPNGPPWSNMPPPQMFLPPMGFNNSNPMPPANGFLPMGSYNANVSRGNTTQIHAGRNQVPFNQGSAGQQTAHFARNVRMLTPIFPMRMCNAPPGHSGAQHMNWIRVSAPLMPINGGPYRASAPWNNQPRGNFYRHPCSSSEPKVSINEESNTANRTLLPNGLTFNQAATAATDIGTNGQQKCSESPTVAEENSDEVTIVDCQSKAENLLSESQPFNKKATANVRLKNQVEQLTYDSFDVGLRQTCDEDLTVTIDALCNKVEENLNELSKMPDKPLNSIPITKEDTGDSSSEPHWMQRLNLPPTDHRVKTSDVDGIRELEFAEFMLNTKLLMGIYEKGWKHPSPIQEETIPAVIGGKDVLARAKNGTGKTGAFCIPILQQIDESIVKLQTLILAPCRELAMQISHTCIALARHTKIRTMVAVGGIDSLSNDILRIGQGVHIIVATPDKILDLMEQDIVDATFCKTLVLDEADALLSFQFGLVLERVFSFLPRNQQVLLFSATFNRVLENFIHQNVKDPIVVNLMSELTLIGVLQYYVIVEEKEKVYVELLSNIIFEFGYCCFFIHGSLPQSYRNSIFHEFREGKLKNLVCTDLFCRGIDVQDVNVVINFDLPCTSTRYLHRIGRTGRYGHHGLAITFVNRAEVQQLKTIEQELKTNIKPFVFNTADETLYAPAGGNYQQRLLKAKITQDDH